MRRSWIFSSFSRQIERTDAFQKIIQWIKTRWENRAGSCWRRRERRFIDEYKQKSKQTKDSGTKNNFGEEKQTKELNNNPYSNAKVQ